MMLTIFQIGCAERYVYQEPAPIHRSRPPVLVRKAPQTIETYKYPDEPAMEPQREIKEETINDNPLPDVTSETAVPDATATDNFEAIPTTDPEVASLPPKLEEPVMPPVSMAGFSPATLSLATEADQNIQSGQYESAGVKIERALRIDPRNAVLTYKLALVRLKQEQPRLAEDLAKKAALLAGNNRDLKKRSWLLIAESKRMQNDADGAQKAEQKAMQF
ncbi:MAG: hypothetical protein ABL903_10910 [Methylococcales bacterium]